MCVCVFDTYHADVEGVEQVKGQGSDQIHKEPGRGVVNADGAGIVHHLTGGADVGGSEVEHDICHTSHNCVTHPCDKEEMDVRWRAGDIRLACAQSEARNKPGSSLVLNKVSSLDV